MKKLILVVFVLIGLSCSAQQKKDTTTRPQYVLILTSSDLDQLFSVIRTSGKYSGAELELFIQSVIGKLTLLSPPADSTKLKKVIK